MPVEHRAYRTAQIFTEPFFWNGAVAADELVILGPYGDADPGYVLVDVVVHNQGDEDVFVASKLTGVTADGARHRVGIEETYPIPGEVDTLCLLGFDACSVQVTASRTPRRNSGKDAGHPGHGEFVVRITPPVAAGIVEVAVPIRHDMTITGVATYSKAVPEEDPPTATVQCADVQVGDVFTFAGVPFTAVAAAADPAAQEFNQGGTNTQDAESLATAFNDPASQALITTALGGTRTVAAVAATGTVALTAAGTDDEYVTNGTLTTSAADRIIVSDVAMTDAGVCELEVEAAGNPLIAAAVDINDLTAATPQAQALTATTAHLALTKGSTLTVRITSDQAALTAGDLAVAISFELA